MFLDEEGNYVRERHHDSHLSVGVPGTVAGLWLAHARHGRLPWRRLVAPAVALARDGFVVDEGLHESIDRQKEKLLRHAATRSIFLPGGEPLAVGRLLVQPDLGRTLERVMLLGASGFYEGETARLLADEMHRGGGILDEEDLGAYEAQVRPPIVGSYRDCKIVSMGPPSSGGVTLISMLNMIEALPLEREPAARVHQLAEVMRRAYADRARWLGSPESVDTEGMAAMLDKQRARKLAAEIDPLAASKSDATSITAIRAEGDHTTHLSVVDRELGAVSLTYTIEQAWGSGIVVPGAGFLLNNEMGDFNARAGPDHRDRSDRDSAEPRPVPASRMLSSMTPTIVLDGRDRPMLVVGSPGGRTIISTVMHLILNVIDLRQPIQRAVDLPRWYQGFLPDRIVIEAALLEKLGREELEAMGHSLKSVPRIGAAECIQIRHRRSGVRLDAGIDPRAPRGGAARSELKAKSGR